MKSRFNWKRKGETEKLSRAPETKAYIVKLIFTSIYQLIDTHLYIGWSSPTIGVKNWLNGESGNKTLQLLYKTHVPLTLLPFLSYWTHNIGIG